MTISEACEAYLHDVKARNLRKSTRQNYHSLFRLLASFAAGAGFESPRDIDSAATREWREGWNCAFSTQVLALT